MKPLPQLNSTERSALLSELMNKSRGTFLKIHRMTRKGQLSPNPDDHMYQYALLGQGRRSRIFTFIFFVVMSIVRLIQLITGGLKTYPAVMFVLLAAVAVLSGLQWYRMRELTGKLGLTSEHFRK